MTAHEADPCDAVIIGAGISGLYQLHRLLEIGLSVQVLETGDDVGGTWYWNRYPGARLDSESYSYGYSFSEELLQEWDWSEHFVSQPEVQRYLRFVADKFDLRPHIRFGSRVRAARFDESDNRWELVTEDGRRVRTRFVITAVGPLSTPVLPRIEGMETFAGAAHHTGLWPAEPVPLEGQRVGVIGTGSSGVQVIQEVAPVAAHLTVFQRRPNYCMPLGNAPLDRGTLRDIKANYPEIFRRCNASLGGSLHGADPRSLFDLDEAEREAFWEALHEERGFALWLGNFSDVMTDPAANELASEFVRRKIRERVIDPEVAEKLIPRDHGFGTKRVPLETGYYEVYNQPNVDLVDVLEHPIERITPRGLVVDGYEHELDTLIYATGFDAITGSLLGMDVRGVGNLSLQDKWADGPLTYLGFSSAGFPNLFTLVGPHNGSLFCNMPRCIEQNVEWTTDLLRFMRDQGAKRIEATPEAETAWRDHVFELAEGSLLVSTDSWFTGTNTNFPERKRSVLQYMGGALAFREKCDEVAARGYEGFRIT